MRLLLVGAVGVLAGCSSPYVAEDLGEPIRTYYARHASEEAGACPRPAIASIVARQPVARQGVRATFRVRYSYFDASVDEAPDWPYVLTAERPCTGFNEREFTLLLRRTGAVVTDMSGERREQE